MLLCSLFIILGSRKKCVVIVTTVVVIGIGKGLGLGEGSRDVRIGVCWFWGIKEQYWI